ncbi:hypothetical protein CapIbe_011349 [Capra ibex]
MPGPKSLGFSPPLKTPETSQHYSRKVFSNNMLSLDMLKNFLGQKAIGVQKKPEMLQNEAPPCSLHPRPSLTKSQDWGLKGRNSKLQRDLPRMFTITSIIQRKKIGLPESVRTFRTVCNMVTKFLADTPNGPSIIFKDPHVFPQMICRLLDSSDLYIRHSKTFEMSLFVGEEKRKQFVTPSPFQFLFAAASSCAKSTPPSSLKRIFPSQESNPGLLHCRQIFYQLSYKGSPPGVKSSLLSVSKVLLRTHAVKTENILESREKMKPQLGLQS